MIKLGVLLWPVVFSDLLDGGQCAVSTTNLNNHKGGGVAILAEVIASWRTAVHEKNLRIAVTRYVDVVWSPPP